MNLVVLQGKLTAKPDTRYTAKGTAITYMVLETKESIRFGKETAERITFFDIDAWGVLGEKSKDFKKGESIMLTGSFCRYKDDDNGNLVYRVIPRTIELISNNDNMGEETPQKDMHGVG